MHGAINCPVPPSNAVSEEVIRSYFTNLTKTVEGVPPENIINYDPTGTHSLMPKATFPSKLKEILCGVLNLENSKSGFKACGNYPLDPDEVLKRLPKPRTTSTPAFDESIVDHLRTLRGNTLGGQDKKSIMRSVLLALLPCPRQRTPPPLEEPWPD